MEWPWRPRSQESSQWTVIRIRLSSSLTPNGPYPAPFAHSVVTLCGTGKQEEFGISEAPQNTKYLPEESLDPHIVHGPRLNLQMIPQGYLTRSNNDYSLILVVYG